MCLAPILEAGYVRAQRAGRMIQFVGMIVGAIGFLGFGSWYFWPQVKEVPAQTGEAVENARRPYQSLSNADLRDNVITFGDALRKMESRYDSLMMPPLIDPSKLPIVTDNQKIQLTKEMVAQQQLYQSLSSQKRQEFESQYRTKAIDLKDKWWFRLRINDYGALREDFLGNSVRSAFDVGLLAGVSPLSNLATYWERLANKLK
jgi:hypothetical protein